MTEKELLYMEDALGHENNIIAICNDIASRLEEKELIEFMKKEAKKHTSFRDKLLKELEVKASE